jgi:hypothetical protein
MPNLLKPNIKLSLTLPQNMDEVLTFIQEQLGAEWHIQSESLRPDTIAFLALREDVQFEGLIERWQGTETRLKLDGKVTLTTPYEDWRDWSAVTSFIALAAIWLLAATLPQTATSFLLLYTLMTSNGLLMMLSSLFLLLYFLGIPFLLHRYITELSPDIKNYAEAQNHLANFVSQVKALQTLPLDTSRLELQNETESVTETLDSQSQTKIKASQLK